MFVSIEPVLKSAVQKNPYEIEFHQAVTEVFRSIEKVMDSFPDFIYHKVLERMIEPERVVMFRVPWVDENASIAAAAYARSNTRSRPSPPSPKPAST